MFCQLPFKVSIYNAFERDILVRAPDCGSGGRRFETALPPGIIKGFRNETLFLVQNLEQMSLVFGQFIS